MKGQFKTWIGCIMALVACFCLNGCGGGNDGEVQKVIIVDKGAVGLSGIMETITFTANKMDGIKAMPYDEKTSTQIVGWGSDLQEGEFNSIKKLISDNNLFVSGDVTLAAGQKPATGWRGMSVTIVKTGNVQHSFQISGEVSDREQWPVGVRELIDFRDALVLKYLYSTPLPPQPS